MDAGFALFDTAIGRCGIAWGARGVTAAALPAAHELVTRDRMAQTGALAAAPPAEIARAIGDIRALLDGEPRDLAWIPLDDAALSPLYVKIYAAARAIPPGTTRTYGELARAIGQPGAARVVGQAMGRNPFPPIVPCHRVVAAGARTGGFSAPGGVATKLRMLAIEGAMLRLY